MTSHTTKIRAAYELQTTTPGLTYPGCTREEATFASEAEAEAALVSLEETCPEYAGFLVVVAVELPPVGTEWS